MNAGSVVRFLHFCVSEILLFCCWVVPDYVSFDVHLQMLQLQAVARYCWLIVWLVCCIVNWQWMPALAWQLPNEGALKDLHMIAFETFCWQRKWKWFTAKFNYRSTAVWALRFALVIYDFMHLFVDFWVSCKFIYLTSD